MSTFHDAGLQSQKSTPEEKIVISGIAGYFPESENVYQLQENLFNKVNMVKEDNQRWKCDHPKLPRFAGRVPNVSKFDASFFGISYKQAHIMDPQCRLLLERVYEAIVDAGVNPCLLKGQRTGVFVGTASSEIEQVWCCGIPHENGYGLTGCFRAMFANQISYWLGVSGPSYTADTACSSSCSVLDQAYRAIRDGCCDSAIVGSCNLFFHPHASIQFSQLGILSPQGVCKTFDKDANGYVRSEAICAIFLQKAHEAKRVYATVLNARSNSDGYKEEGIFHPSGNTHKLLLDECYQECGADKHLLEYVEAHGTGTKVGDLEELKAITLAFCKDRKTPLLIGSVKSNTGHTEGASGLCGVIKVIISMETGFIPPNLHYSNPREGVESLMSGQLKVVTEKVPWAGNLASVSSLGFGGANTHIILQRNQKEKVNGGAPADSIPRLVVASGRTEEAVDVILKDFESHPDDAEFVRLMHDLQSAEIVGHKYRGYTLPTQDGSNQRSIKFYPGRKRPVWFVFTGMGSQWPGMGKSLLTLPVFAAVINKCQGALKPHGVDVIDIITSDDSRLFSNILNCFVGIAAFQLGLVDIMRAVGIEPDGFVGFSLGELGCGYMDRCFSVEQMMLVAYYCGRAVLETELIRGSMAVVCLGAQQARKLCPPDIEVACNIGPKFCTLSGPAEPMKNFLKILQEDGIFAEMMDCGNIAHHSKHMSPVGPLLLNYLKEFIPHAKLRSSHWVSSSVPQSEWNSPAATHSSAEYITNSQLNPVLFEEASRHIPHNAITIEIAPHGLLHPILECSLNKGITNIALTQRGYPDSTEWLLTALGKLYELGLQPQLANLYPQVQYPVSRGTPMISPLVRWEHSEDWYVMRCITEPKFRSGERSVSVSLQDESTEYLSGHVIDSRNEFPATGYLELVWKSVGLMTGKNYTEVPIVFEDVQFHRSTSIPEQGNLHFTVMVQKVSGKFEVTESNTPVVSGLVRVPTNVSHEMVALEPPRPIVNEDLLEFSSKDIYKYFRLCGYEYEGLFRGLVCADNHGQIGKVYWKDNWVAFLDNMLQMKIFEKDTRDLLVPTSLKKLTIDAKWHAAEVQKLNAENSEVVVPVHVYKEQNIIQAAGVEFRGLKTSAVSWRKPLSKLVLEKYVLTLNVEPAHLDLHTALRVCIHITLENKPVTQVKVVELHTQGSTPLASAVVLILADRLLLKGDITVLTKARDLSGTDLDMTGIKVEEHELWEEQNCTLVIASNILLHTELLQTAVNALADGACLLAREKVDTDGVVSNGFRLETVFEKTLKDEKLLLLRKGVTVESPVVIHVSGHNYDWLPEVQTAISSSSKRHIILVAQGEPLSGIVGLVNCIRKEPGSDYVRCFFILEPSAPPFDVNLPLYSQQLIKDLVMNVYSDGKWGSYRHLPLDSCATITTPHVWLNIMTPGDLSSFKWLEGNLDPECVQAKSDENLVQIYYSALNFKNVLLAAGKVAANVFIKDPLNEDSLQGMEFSGRDQRGHRVMGITSHRALASVLQADRAILWDVPDHWMLEDAATVPVVYATAYYALVTIGNLKKGESVLIHSGTGGVGQAAINICLHAGCTVYTTVGTKEKLDFIKRQYPQLTDCNIGSSRDTSFEQLVITETNGRGVDLVLNSLPKEKLHASVNCLAPRGRFLEIGRIDLANNSLLGMEVFLKGISFHGVMLDEVFHGAPEPKKIVHDMITQGISAGVVQPLPRTVFPDTEVEQAFRYMAAGKHIGKVLVQIRLEEDGKVVVPVPRLMQAYPRYFCNPSYSYIIAGGLGGFGLELARWLMLRGARKLVISSRSGIKTGYQCFCVRTWRSYGANVVISLANITTESGVRALLSEANRLGQVDAIFNLAMVLRDAILENQTEAHFVTCAEPKAIATLHLDKLSCQMCPHLRHFVVFSSMTSGLGNAGQTSYGMSNSIMERICEARVRDGLPGLAVQWGAVGDVGLVAEMQEEHKYINTGGTLPQRIASCLEVLDGFMRLSCPIVSSVVVAEKDAGSDGRATMVDCVSDIMGIHDLKTVSLKSTLSDLGMDSLTSMNIQQSLEQEFGVFLTPGQIRSLTFTRLSDMAANKQEEQPSRALSVDDDGCSEGLQLLLRLTGDEASAAQPVVHLPSAAGAEPDTADDVKAGPLLFMLTGAEGVACILEPLAKNLKYQTVCLQLNYRDIGQTIQDMAQSLLPHIHSRLAPGEPFNLLGYSFGGLLALELALELEVEGREGHLYLVDSAPVFMKILVKQMVGSDKKKFLTNLMCTIFKITAPYEATSEAVSKLAQEIALLKSWDEKTDHLFAALPMLKDRAQHYKSVFASILVRLKAAAGYEWNHSKRIKSHTILLRPTSAVLKAEEDYGLSKLCEKMEVHFVPGNHVTVLDKKETAAIINRPVATCEHH